MSTTSTVGKNYLLAGIKAGIEASGANPQATIVYLATAVVVATVNAAAVTPSAGVMTLTSGSGSCVATGTLTAVELRDRNNQVVRTYTVGAQGSGRDIIITPSGSGVSAVGNDIVVSSIGTTVGALTLSETPS